MHWRVIIHVHYIFLRTNASGALTSLTLGSKQLVQMFCEVICEGKNTLMLIVLRQEAHDSFEQAADLKEERNGERDREVNSGQ